MSRNSTKNILYNILFVGGNHKASAFVTRSPSTSYNDNHRNLFEREYVPSNRDQTICVGTYYIYIYRIFIFNVVMLLVICQIYLIVYKYTHTNTRQPQKLYAQMFFFLL